MVAAPLLVCLDLQGRAAARPGERRAAAARRVLDRARDGGWEVAHVCRAQGAGRGAPLPGLGPLPSEPLYRRDTASAFDARHFPERLRDGGGLVAILSLDLDCAALVTALTAAELGRWVVLLTDATEESASLAAVRGLVAALRQDRLQLRRFDALAARAPPRSPQPANQP